MVTKEEGGTDAPGGRPGDGGSDADRTLALIRELGHRAAVARGLRSDIQLRLLRSILDAAVALFNAAAASIALESDGELEFVVAAGEQGQGVVGRRVPAGQGLVGYVFQTGEPLALGDTSSDPRFGRQVAEQTGYVPRTILAVPLATGEETVGVLEVLDRRAGVFSGDDLALASVFARQAALAIDATRVERDVGRLWARVLEAHDLHPDEAGQDAFAAAVADLDPGDDFWSLVDAVAREWSTSPERRAFVIELLRLVDRFRPTTRARPFAR
jgi:GAF domain-containing protein